VTRLIVVPAAEVGDRPRWWTHSPILSDAECEGGPVLHNDLHNGPAEEGERYAIVADDSPEQSAPPAVDSREADVWFATYLAVLPVLVGERRGAPESVAVQADLHAMAALVTWRKRFGRKEGP
jgi:hypothetical protein